ncbi:beta-glucosidase BglX [bacterium]|nr:beta-glucosidase BglX [bacterium]
MTQAPTPVPKEPIVIGEIIARMTRSEKLGQLCIVDTPPAPFPDEFVESIRTGRIGAIMNLVEPDQVNELQRIAMEESRLGIPLLVARDVIHGFKTIFPIPLAQAASWDPDLVRECTRVAAHEAASTGVNWTFAPMIDISRDPRWGRIAESFGEDVHLTGVFARATVKGLQGENPAAFDTIAACAKHFAGYGASESGRDYNTTNIPENELRNVYLPPFRDAIEANVLSLMSSFGDLDGIPATANDHLMNTILRKEWGFEGVVVSDWEAVPQLGVHGLTADDKESAEQALRAGIDIEMASMTYARYASELIDEGRISEVQLDALVANVLRMKQRLGLFDKAQTDPAQFRTPGHSKHLDLAKRAAVRSMVLLKNENGRLPLRRENNRSIAVLGPLADEPNDQLGTWVFDGDPSLSVTPLQALRARLGEACEIRHARGLNTTRHRAQDGFAEAVDAAKSSDVALVFLGEEAILSGEAHCRADIGLPGNQAEFLRAVHETGTPVVLVLMTGRPLTLGDVIDYADAILLAWHPGTMAGPAIVDLLFGNENPSGKLPVTFPRAVGQIPLYYAHKITGRPPTPETVVRMEDVEKGLPQHAVGNTSFHLDVDPSPLFPFGYGLSYAQFEFKDPVLDTVEISTGDSLSISVTVTNTSDRYAGEEVVQLYVRDMVGSLTRPVRELKGFQRVHLDPGASARVTFRLTTDELAFYTRRKTIETEPGRFRVWVGADSTAQMGAEFILLP